MIEELESTVLENLSHLRLGNLDAYTDGLRLGRPVVLVGVRAGDNYVGDGADLDQKERLPLAKHNPQMWSKNLDVRVSPGAAFGWVFDEISYRVEVDGRWASLPVRITAVYVRDVDRWTLAADHWSYPREPGELTAAAGSAAVPPPDRIAGDRDGRDADALVGIVGRLENGDVRIREARLSREAGALRVLPGAEGEYHEGAIAEAPSLGDLFGGDATVGLRDHRIEVAASGAAAWMTANLVVRPAANEGLEILLRASYVFVHGPRGWQVVQSHISAPLPRGYLTNLVFGEPPVAAEGAEARQ